MCPALIESIRQRRKNQLKYQQKTGTNAIRMTTTRAAAPHPNPLPVKNGERERTAVAVQREPNESYFFPPTVCLTSKPSNCGGPR